MSKKVVGLTICAVLLVISFPAGAQQPKKVPRIGYLSSVDQATDSPRREGIRRALRELGYIEGQSIIIEYRHAAFLAEAVKESKIEKLKQ